MQFVFGRLLSLTALRVIATADLWGTFESNDLC